MQNFTHDKNKKYGYIIMLVFCIRYMFAYHIFLTSKDPGWQNKNDIN